MQGGAIRRPAWAHLRTSPTAPISRYAHGRRCGSRRASNTGTSEVSPCLADRINLGTTAPAGRWCAQTEGYASGHTTTWMTARVMLAWHQIQNGSPSAGVVSLQFPTSLSNPSLRVQEVSTPCVRSCLRMRTSVDPNLNKIYPAQLGQWHVKTDPAGVGG